MLSHYQNDGVELRIHGVVQGVGFRPFIYRLAQEYQLSGSIANTGGESVVIRIEPPVCNLKDFLDDLKKKAPPLSSITKIEQQKITATGQQGFVILPSETKQHKNVEIPVDTALCDDCLRELFDPSDRRYLYPFINCTNCGPRLTIIASTPYDRPRTSMKAFSMCKDCRKEYLDPFSRRFHAQPNACDTCGPKLTWHDANGQELEVESPIDSAADALSSGKIVAIRGMGGFHLAVDAASTEAVDLLRKRKGRAAKPLAVMVKDCSVARTYCHVSDDEEALLRSYQHPILLLKQKEEKKLAPAISPGIDMLGIMLPYTPFHHVLFASPLLPEAIVMTSGNISGEAICIDNQEAIRKLHGVADFFLLHDRDILTRIDDSVVCKNKSGISIMRRSRGYAPSSIKLPFKVPDILACGAELKNTFCLASGNSAYLSQHIGDLTNTEAFDFYEESVKHLTALFDIKPDMVVCDMHPDYLSSRYAQNSSLPIIAVQHHHAHAAAVMAEHKLNEKCLAVLLDGAGYGPDGTVWGGEILLADYKEYKRLAHLQHLHLPGGDIAAVEPWRMAAAACYMATGELKKEIIDRWSPAISADKTTFLVEMMEKSLNSPYTSSCGRLFDGVSALLDLRLTSQYEGQAAMELESLARQAISLNRSDHRISGNESVLPVSIDMSGDIGIIKSAQMIETLLDMFHHGSSSSQLALEFHFWLVESLTATLKEVCADLGKKPVLLSGGCMQNGLLLDRLVSRLNQEGFQVFSGNQIPMNDGGIALGQAAIGGYRSAASPS